MGAHELQRYYVLYTTMDLETEVVTLRKQVLTETIRRLSAEMQAAKASMAAIQMRIPMIEAEMSLAQGKLAELTKGQDNGPSDH